MTSMRLTAFGFAFFALVAASGCEVSKSVSDNSKIAPADLPTPKATVSPPTIVSANIPVDGITWRDDTLPGFRIIFPPGALASQARVTATFDHGASTLLIAAESSVRLLQAVDVLLPTGMQPAGDMPTSRIQAFLRPLFAATSSALAPQDAQRPIKPRRGAEGQLSVLLDDWGEISLQVSAAEIGGEPAAPPAPVESVPAPSAPSSSPVAGVVAPASDAAAPRVAIISPTPGAFVAALDAAAFPVSGICSDDGVPVSVSEPVTASVACANGAWAAHLDFSGLGDGPVSIKVLHSRGGISGTASVSVVKDMIAPVATVEVTEKVMDPGALMLHAASDLAAYRYKIVAGSTCFAGAFGEWRSPAVPLTATLTDAGRHSLCLLGRDLAQNTQVTPTVVPLIVLSYQDVAAENVAARSETSLALSWTAPAGVIVRYDIFLSALKGQEPDTSGAPFATISDAAATSAVLTGLAPGSLGKVRVRARLRSDTAVAGSAASTAYWTPFGALNQPSVNATVPTAAGAFPGSYAEAVYVSPSFSLITGHFYVPEFSYVYDKVPANGDVPIYALGSATVATPGYSSKHLRDYAQIWSDGTKVAIAESFGSPRVLLFNHPPVDPAQATPDVVLGQTDKSLFLGNAGQAGPNRQGFDRPGGVCFNGTTLYVADNTNNRILGYNGWPTATGHLADFVMGQPNFTTNTANNGGVSLTSLSGPATIDCQEGRLIVTDSGNNRVLIWTVAPVAGGVAADVVVGQANGAASGVNGAGGASQGGLNGPTSAIVMVKNAVRYLLVSEWSNNRVVQWDGLPSTHGEAFDRVYGQPDRSTTTANTGGVTKSTLNAAVQVNAQVGSDRFWVSDWGNGRFAIWELNGTAAVGVWGHRTEVNTGGAWGSVTPTHIDTNRWWGWNGNESTGMNFTVDPDTGVGAVANRVWMSAPQNGQTPPDFFRGANDLYEDPFFASSASSGSVNSVATIGGRVFWADGARILSKTGTFAANNEAADLILGSKDMAGSLVTTDTWNYKFNTTIIARSGNALLAIDGPRIVGWHNPGSASNQQIDFALGQSSLTTHNANEGGLSASSLSASVMAMTVAGGKLIVADTANNRVLIWNDASALATGTAADVVLGQAAFNTAAGGSGTSGMLRPSGVMVVQGRLFVADRGNNRLLIWNTVPTVSGTGADQAIDTRAMLRFGLPAWFDGDTLVPAALTAWQGRLYFGMYDRVLVVPDFF